MVIVVVVVFVVVAVVVVIEMAQILQLLVSYLLNRLPYTAAQMVMNAFFLFNLINDDLQQFCNYMKPLLVNH